MTDVPMWVQAAVNDERRKLRENQRLQVLAERVEAKIISIGNDPGRERGRSEVLRLPRHPPVRSSRVYGSGEGRLVLWQQVGDRVLILGIVPIE